jgi:hypothetical protein
MGAACIAESRYRTHRRGGVEGGEMLESTLPQTVKRENHRSPPQTLTAKIRVHVGVVGLPDLLPLPRYLPSDDYRNGDVSLANDEEVSRVVFRFILEILAIPGQVGRLLE